jgi:phosphotriesterase-related protein
MNETALTGKIQTVLGIIDAEDLGVTLPHEHIIADLSIYFTEPTEASGKILSHQPITLKNLYWVHCNRFNNIDNLKLCDEQLAIEEALLYKWSGGTTIVELSSIGLSRDPLALARISRATGLNIVMGSGYYLECSHPPELAGMTEGEITEEIIRDIMIGVGNTGVRAGIIGEIGCTLPLTDSERKVLRASAAAQQRTGAALNIHPTFRDDCVLEIIKILGDAGADLSRTIIDHLHMFSPTTIREIADLGCYIEFDTFGHPITLPSSYPIHTFSTVPLHIPRSEPALLVEIKQLIDEGYLKQILISHDVCFKYLYTAYGGAGYAHILHEVVPCMLCVEGISEEQIHTIMVENPKRILSFAPVKDKITH